MVRTLAFFNPLRFTRKASNYSIRYLILMLLPVSHGSSSHLYRFGNQISKNYCTRSMVLDVACKRYFPSSILWPSRRVSRYLLENNRKNLPLFYWGSTYRSFSIRGGSSDQPQDHGDGKAPSTKYEILDSPAPGSPFHYAFPVHSLESAKDFYGNILGCKEGRSSSKWQDYSLHGHQIVCHWVGNDYRCVDYYNPVDGDEVPVPHAGLALTVEQFHTLAERLRKAGVTFILEPHLRFQGMPGEQWTMFFKDPSGNNLEFKAMTKIENLFAKYNVVDSK